MPVEDRRHTPPVDARRGFSRNLIDEQQPGECLFEREVGRGWEVIRERLPVDSVLGGFGYLSAPIVRAWY